MSLSQQHARCSVIWATRACIRIILFAKAISAFGFFFFGIEWNTLHFIIWLFCSLLHLWLFWVAAVDSWATFTYFHHIPGWIWTELLGRVRLGECKFNRIFIKILKMPVRRKKNCRPEGKFWKMRAGKRVFGWVEGCVQRGATTEMRNFLYAIRTQFFFWEMKKK